MKYITMLVLSLLIATGYADQSTLYQKMWANQAIMATYQISNANYIEDQKEIAKYFTSNAWARYLQALTKANIQKFLADNNYRVNAVALKPVDLKTIDKDTWEAKMPVLVQYSNPQYDQLQTVMVTIQFKKAEPGAGFAGFQMISYLSVNIDKPCKCMIGKGKANLSVN